MEYRYIVNRDILLVYAYSLVHIFTQKQLHEINEHLTSAKMSEVLFPQFLNLNRH